jgi:glycyl-tRNA synthetase beta subunit
MPNFLFEVGTEELPATFVDRARTIASKIGIPKAVFRE